MLGQRGQARFGRKGAHTWTYWTYMDGWIIDARCCSSQGYGPDECTIKNVDLRSVPFVTDLSQRLTI